MSEPHYLGKLIHQEFDDFGPLEVTDDGVFRYLHFGDETIQSLLTLGNLDYLSTTYNQCFALSLIFKPDPEHVMIMGTGGGILHRFLLKYAPCCQIHAIELRESVTAIAEEYFYLPTDKTRLHIQHDDAVKNISGAGPCYDIIFVDIFLRGSGSPSLISRDFFTHCKRRLNATGILCFHLWLLTENDVIHNCMSEMIAVFGDNFLVLPVEEEGVIVVMAFQHSVTIEKTHEYQANELTRRTQNDFATLFRTMKPYLTGMQKPLL